MKKIFAILLTLVLLAPTLSFAGRGHGSHSSTRTPSSRKYVSPRKKTVQVHSYTKKDGTHVDSYNRRPPRRK